MNHEIKIELPKLKDPWGHVVKSHIAGDIGLREIQGDVVPRGLYHHLSMQTIELVNGSPELVEDGWNVSINDMPSEVCSALHRDKGQLVSSRLHSAFKIFSERPYAMVYDAGNTGWISLTPDLASAESSTMITFLDRPALKLKFNDDKLNTLIEKAEWYKFVMETGNEPNGITLGNRVANVYADIDRAFAAFNECDCVKYIREFYANKESSPSP